MIDKKKFSGFYLLSDNTDAFVARLALISNAKKTLDIQYYIIHSDASGQYLAYALLQAADRGVHVRILVDDINLSGRDNSLKMLSQHENIEIRIFNPLSNRKWFRNFELLINLDSAGRRMHNKAFIVDNTHAIIGGRNIGDEYFDARQERNFVDLDILITGDIVNNIKESFEDYWCSQWATPVEQLSKIKVIAQQLITIRNTLKDRWLHAKNTQYFLSLKQSELTTKILTSDIPYIQASAKLFYDCPEKILSDTNNQLIHFSPDIMSYFETTNNELLITTPYFVPGVKGLDWLIKKQKENTRIKVLTNSLSTTDVIAVHAGYKKYREKLIKAGIDLFELKANTPGFREKTKRFIKGFSSSSLHAKYMVVDQHYVFIGSANVDPRSNNLNTEIGIMIDSESLANQTKKLFEKTTDLNNSYQLSLNAINNKINWHTIEGKKETNSTSEPNASTRRRFMVFIISLLPIESLL